MIIRKPKKSFAKFKKSSQGLFNQEFLLGFSGATAALASAAALCSNIEGDEAQQSVKHASNTWTNSPSNINNEHSSQSNLSKCEKCGYQIEYYGEETIGTLIVICSTFIHRDCTLAASDILDMLVSITKLLIVFCFEFLENLS